MVLTSDLILITKTYIVGVEVKVLILITGVLIIVYFVQKTTRLIPLLGVVLEMVVDKINVARVRINLSARWKTAVEVSNAVLATQN